VNVAFLGANNDAIAAQKEMFKKLLGWRKSNASLRCCGCNPIDNFGD
jgi:hypothetical protein